jgi:hypothetical protein
VTSPNSRVGLVTLRVRAGPELGGAGAVRTAAERFTRAVLERAADLIEARAPGRVVLVRRLPLHWRLAANTLDDRAVLDRLASDIADALLAHAVDEASPTEFDELVVFRDEADWRAAHLDARARGESAGAWFFGDLAEEGNPLSALADPARASVASAVLLRLADRGRLASVLASEPARSVETLAWALGVSDDAPPGSGSVPAQGEPVPAALLEFVNSLPPGLPTPALALILHARAAPTLGPYATTGDIAAIVHAALTCLCPVASVPPVTVGRVDPIAPDAVGPTPSPDAPLEATHTTDFGGLFYLLNLALELDAGQALWSACLPEGAVLAHAAALLLGEEGAGDAAPALFGGTAPRRPLPMVAPEQQDEVSAVLLDTLVEALPRRGLAPWPVASLATADHTAGRLLVVTAEGSPFVLFARPAPDVAALRTGVARFLASWPRSAPTPRSEPGLATLDASGRLQAASLGPAPLLPETASATSAALLAQIAGAPAFLFAARVAAPTLPTAAGFAGRFLRLRARVILADEALTIVAPADAVNLPVRRAGLDRDPGWVPWLGRNVRFLFVGAEDV